jgi:hypothetical protein
LETVVCPLCNIRTRHFCTGSCDDDRLDLCRYEQGGWRRRSPQGLYQRGCRGKMILKAWHSSVRSWSETASAGAARHERGGRVCSYTAGSGLQSRYMPFDQVARDPITDDLRFAPPFAGIKTPEPRNKRERIQFIDSSRSPPLATTWHRRPLCAALGPSFKGKKTSPTSSHRRRVRGGSVRNLCARQHGIRIDLECDGDQRRDENDGQGAHSRVCCARVRSTWTRWCAQAG